MPTTFLAPPRAAHDVVADMRRRADDNERAGNLARAAHLRNLARRLVAALNLE